VTWDSTEGDLTWTTLFRLANDHSKAEDPHRWSAWDEFDMFDKFESVAEPKISITTDGQDVKLVGAVEVDPTPWLSRHSTPEVRLLADGMIQIAERLGVNLRKELLARVKKKEALPPVEKKAFRVLNTEELWNLIKSKTKTRRHEWAELVFGAPDAEAVRLAREWKDGRMNYVQLKEALKNNVNWCKKSTTTGMVPSWILAEIRGARMNDVVAFYIDTGMVLPLAGVVWYVDKGAVMLQPWRITNGYYCQRTGLNREREAREREGNVGLSWAERMAEDKGKTRRMLDEGFRQLQLEIAATFWLAAYRLGDGRDPVVIVEAGGSASRGGWGHRKLATDKLVRSLAHFFLVGTSSGFRTSQACPICGAQTEFGNQSREIRSKVCKSPDCPGTDKMREWNQRVGAEHKAGKRQKKGAKDKDKGKTEGSDAGTKREHFHADRDIMAAVNLCLIDEAEAKHGMRPERFQSEYYKRRKHVSSSV
jgi:hypothetical protein